MTPEAAAPNLPTTVLPGDDLTPYILPNSSTTKESSGYGSAATTANKPRQSSTTPKIGTGLAYDATTQRITATLAGRLHYRPASRTYHVLSNPKRYRPSNGDRVVGIVEEKASAEYYRVNIFGPHPALLHHLAFEGATKRNKPHLKPGSLLYCRVILNANDGAADPSLTCQVGGDGTADGGAARKDWMTDEGTYGELKGGTVTRIGLGLARELLLPSNVVLASLATYDIPFEIAVGVNGVLWVHSSRPEYTILVTNAIRNSEVMTPEQVRGMVKALVKTVRSELQQD